MSDEATELTPELLEDFHAECEDQLTAIRAQLVQLERSDGASSAAALESLYRNVHSFKGNAAIVGLTAAEQLAHAAEGLLRPLTRGGAALDATTLDLLARVALRLEQIAAAFRAQQSLPPTTDLLEALPAAHLSAAIGGPPPPPGTEGADRASWQIRFRPRAELDRRGVNVTSIRARLAALGTIRAAQPTVEPGGGMRFDFTVAVAQPPGDLPAWEQDGITWERSPAPTPAQPAPGGAPATPDTLFATPSHVVRVALSRLDDLMRVAGDMVIHRSRLQDRIAQVPGDTSALQDVNLALTRSLRELRAAIMRVRMVPVVEIFSRLPLVVRDLTRGTDKHVRIALEGQHTEVDKYIVERLKEPLLHLVRNAVSHGIETATDREATGKAPEATLRLCAATSGETVEITVQDDGRGIDATAIAARAREVGLSLPEIMDDPALLRLVCIPGFSTRAEADRVSGRGVGMAVVAAAVRELGGTLQLASTPGRGTQFTLRLPLTLSVADAFVVSAGSHHCAVPRSQVEEVMPMPAAEMRRLNAGEMAPYRGTLVPLIRLRQLFGLGAPGRAELPVLVLKTDRGLAGLVVDGVVGQREVVVRPMTDPLLRVPGISGATELGDGRPVLILNAATLLQAVTRTGSPRRAGNQIPSS